MEDVATTPNTKKRKLNFISTPSPKRTRIDLTLEQKINLIKDSESKPKLTQKELSVKYGIGKTTVCDILKRKEFYLKQHNENLSMTRKRFTSGSKFTELNELLFKWFQQARAKTIPISGPVLQEKALQFARELKIDDFQASNGWLHSWKSRYAISCFKVCGESADVDQTVVTDYRDRLKTIAKNYEPKDIFNCDETGLFFRTLPDTTLAVKGSECKGGKSSKERLTVMLCCSASGEKLKPLVIGKARKPRSFKNINVNTLPVDWRHNRKAWMTGELFFDWVSGIDRKMKSQKRKIILFLDNATSHGHSLKFNNVKLQFLPANTTSKLQPLDLGIIRAFKSRYRKRLTRHVISKIETSGSASQVAKSVNVLDAVYWVDASWRETKPETIEKCFKKAGFPQATPDIEDSEDSEDDVPLSRLAAGLSKENDETLQRMEDELPIENPSTDEWESDLLNEHLHKKDVNITSDSSSESEAETETPEVASTHADILGHLQEVRKFGLFKDDRYVGPITELIMMTEQTLIEQKMDLIQPKIDTFFKAKE